MQYDALKTFVTLVEVKNFTKTAEILLMSQPNVSLQIKNLEEELQSKLFIRSPRKLTLTPTGEFLYERAKQILSITEKTKKEILEHQQTVKGIVKIGASFTIGEYLLPDLLYAVQERYPELEFQVMIGNTEEIVECVRLFEVDLGLIEGQTNVKEILVEPFMDDELLIVSSPNHPLAQKQIVTMEDLQDQQWIRRESGSGTREYLDHVIRSNGLRVQSYLTISSNQGIKEIMMNGLGLSLLSYHVIKRELAQGSLSTLRLKNHAFKRKFSYILSPIMMNKRNVEAFFEVLHRKWG